MVNMTGMGNNTWYGSHDGAIDETELQAALYEFIAEQETEA